jgi:hypothetical protein
MQTFKGDLIVKSVGDRSWQIIEPFYFYFDEKDKSNGVVVPAGFITDFASVPRILWSIYPPTGRYSKATVIHDYLYSAGKSMGYDRKFCDKMLLNGMEALDVGFFVRLPMYIGVRLFGFLRFCRKI